MKYPYVNHETEAERDEKMKAAPELITTSNIPETVVDVLRNVAAHPLVEKLILFGSRAVGDHEERSDVDIAVVGERLSQREFAILWNEVDEGNTLFSIDLSHFGRLPDKLQKSVLKQGVLLYERTHD